MSNPEYTVEFVFDYMVILTDAQPIWKEDLTEEAIMELARANLISEYSIDPEMLNVRDIIIHPKDEGYLPPSHPYLTIVK